MIVSGISHMASYRPISQIPQCTISISHNAPFCNKNVHVCTFLLKNSALLYICLMHCGICEMGLLPGAIIRMISKSEYGIQRGWIDMKMPSFLHRKSRCGDKMIFRLFTSAMGFHILVRYNIFILNQGPDTYRCNALLVTCNALWAHVTSGQLCM